MTNRIRKRTSVIDNIRTWTNKRQRNIDNMLVNPATIIKYVREYGRGNQKGQHRETGNIWYTRRRKPKQKRNTIFVGHHYAQTNTNNVNKTCALLQTTGGKDDPNIVFKSVHLYFIYISFHIILLSYIQ